MSIAVFYLISFLLFLLFSFVFYFLLQNLFTAPYLPTPTKRLANVLSKHGAKDGKKFIDLGAGDGRVVRTAARMGMDASGVESNPFFALISKITTGGSPIKYGSMHKQNLDEYDVVYMYLVPKSIRKLAPKLSKELKPGTTLISYGFEVPELQLVEVADREFYVYKA